MLHPRDIVSFAAVAAVAGLCCSAAEIPPPPSADWTVFPSCQVRSTAEARAVFEPMTGSLPVTLVGEGPGAWVSLPGNFKGTTHQRCSWDIRIDADLAAARGLQFLFYSAGSEPVSQVSLYCHSGNGWYSTTADIRRDGVWQRVLFDKSRTKTEGTPAGWGAVDLLRVSAWRAGADADTAFGIAHIGPLASTAPVLVLRADSAAGGPEATSVAQFVETVSRCLDDIGIESAVLSDRDVTAARLAGRKLVVLPHNPSVPDEAMAALREFVAGGGRLLSFYGCPAEVLELIGMTRGEWQRAPGGPFRGIARVGDGLPGQPEVVRQASWNITPARPATPEARVVAVWQAADGTTTDLPALTVSPRGAHMAHVLLSDDWPGKRRLMLAMVAGAFPDAWAQAARHELDGAGRWGRFESLDDLGAALSRLGMTPATQAAWATAMGARQKAQEAIRKESYLAAIDAAQAAAKAAREAWCMAQPAVPGEHRAFWCHSAFGLDGQTWDESIGLLKRSGFTAILPNLLWGGVAFYPGEVLPPYADLARRGDQMQLCLDACRKYGIECHVWKVNWNMGSATDPAWVQRMVAAGRVQQDAQGVVSERWLCPSHPENQALEVAAMVDLARRYPIDGLHFDYIRYPDSQHCFCPGCRSRFEAHLGAAVEGWPAAVRQPGALRQRWLDWRREAITAVVRAVSEQARQARPGIRISAAVFRQWPTDRDEVGQDWKLWCERGYLDFVCPMDYTESTRTFQSQVRRQLEWSSGKPCYPGIGLSCWADPSDVMLLLEQIAICRELGTGGFTIFNFDRHAREVLPGLALGATAR